MTTTTEITRPTEELHAAAARVRQFAKGTTPADGDPSGWLGHANEETGHTFIFGGPTKDGYRTGVVFEFKDELDCEECHRPSTADLDWMWLMCPLLAEPIAALFDSAAEFLDGAVGTPPSGYPVTRVLELARAINGEVTV